MASPGHPAPSGTKPRERALPEEHRSQALATMTDQQNLEPQRPASADPAVALAEMLGQLPQPAAEQPKPAAPKVSVEDLAQELGLKLGDQNELTIRRIK